MITTFVKMAATFVSTVATNVLTAETNVLITETNVLVVNTIVLAANTNVLTVIFFEVTINTNVLATDTNVLMVNTNVLAVKTNVKTVAQKCKMELQVGKFIQIVEQLDLICCANLPQKWKIAQARYNCLNEPVSTNIKTNTTTYFTAHPFIASACGLTNINLPSLFSAINIMPLLSMPRILRGAKLATSVTCNPTTSSGV